MEGLSLHARDGSEGSRDKIFIGAFMNQKPEKHRVVAIMLTWPDHKFVITTRNARVAENPNRYQELLREMVLIVKSDATEVWREAESLLAAAEKPMRLDYALFFEHSPMFSGQRDIVKKFVHGDFAKEILAVCKKGGKWVEFLSSGRQKEIMTMYKEFRETHEITVTTQ